MPVVSVLWGLGLLTAIALSLLWNGNMAYSLAHNGLETVGVNATVEAGVNRAVAGLLDPRTERRWRSDGATQSFEFNGTLIKVSIQDELGKIDLNQAEAPLLASLLRSNGLNPDAASSLADKIVDWRTTTSLRSLNGAKEQDYRALGSSYRPRNGPFQSIDELLLVMDMTPALFRRIEPALTVYSGRQFIDPQVAPREALRALPNMTPDSVESALAERARRQLALDPSVGDVLASLRGRAFSIRTEFATSNRTILREVTVRLTENPNQPYWPLSWRAK
ncbi:general secretion pathway protein GspK [Bradyrhizobium sp. AUGA SZCCT0274]|nr:general secretion pathway protein GspK [Bradyrhizobium sp. AUGA SZCCT0274]